MWLEFVYGYKYEVLNASTPKEVCILMADTLCKDWCWTKVHVFQWNSIVQLYTGFVKSRKYVVITALSEINVLNHWGRVSHTWVDHLTIIGSDNVLSPGRHQTIIWTSAGILLTGLLKTNVSEILFEIQTFPLTKIHLKISYAKCPPFCPCLHVLINNISNEYEPKHVTPCYYLPQTRRVCM